MNDRVRIFETIQMFKKIEDDLRINEILQIQTMSQTIKRFGKEQEVLKRKDTLNEKRVFLSAKRL
jgi:cell fate (sporulation/competence/biofilm development) regulator YmcA (YheA/YmcA/DUF963 family)